MITTMAEWKMVLITAVIFICMSISLTIEKVSMIWCFETLRKPDIDITTGYLMLLIITGMPSFVSLLQILWNVPFLKRSKVSQCPSPASLIVGITSQMIEGVCLVFFAATVAPILPIYILIPLLNGVLTIPILLEEISKLKKNSHPKFQIFPNNEQISRHRILWKIISTLVISLLPTVIGCLLYIRGVITRDQAFCISATVFGLSIVWWPELRTYTLKTKFSPVEKPKKISILYATIKVASIIISIGIHFYITVEGSPNFSEIFSQLIRGIDQLLKWTIGLPLILNFTSALFSHALAYLTLALSINTFGIVIPSITSSAAAIALCRTFLGAKFYAISEEVDSRTFLPIAVATLVALVIWCYPYLIKTSDLIPKPPFLFIPFEAVFHSYGWDCIFFDQYLILGIKDLRKYENEAEKKTSEISKAKLSQIFVCTTMYREADYEMERFLMSLRGLSTSSILNDVIMEAHIFMDNGCTSTSLKEFAQQLVELSQQKLNLSISDGSCAETPYGIQISWKLPGGMPLYMHFKDPLKIKPKKRWSQAMYFQYILRFRLIQNVDRYQLKTGACYFVSDHIAEKKMGKHISPQNLTALIGTRFFNKSKSSINPKVKNSKNHAKTDNNSSILQRSSIFEHNIEKVGYPTLFTNQSSVEISSENVVLNETEKAEHSIETHVSDMKTSSTVSSIVSHDQVNSMAALYMPGSSQTAFQSAYVIDTATATDTMFKETDKEESTSPNKIYQMESNVLDNSFDSDTFSDVSSISSHGNTKDSKILDIEVKTEISHSTKTKNQWNASSLPVVQSIPASTNMRHNSHISPIPKSKANQMTFDEVLPVENANGSIHPPLCSEDVLKDRPHAVSYLEKISGESYWEKTSDARWIGAAGVDKSQVYILATDADMEFKDSAVLELLQMCNNDKRIGAACGRTHPQGKRTGPVVWHQIFEYAKDFWMIKTAQNVIGSVMCCPGCFSLYRATAVQEVLPEYTKPTKSPFAVYVKDTGEDRWMATLLMVNGWYMRYSCFARNNTYCPDTFEEFLKQRRRWVLSDIANAVLVVRNLISLIRYNACFSACYVIYMLNMFLNNIITPGTAVVMITAGLDLVFEVPYLYTTVPLAVIVLLYSVFCTRASTRAQTYFTLILTVILGGIFFAVVVWGSATIVRGIIIDIMAEKFHFQQHYIIMLITLSFIYAAAMHPSESYMVFYGLAYVFIFPAMHILLPIYSISNIVDQSWGTRDSQKPKKPKKPSIFRCIRRKKHKAKMDILRTRSCKQILSIPTSEENAENSNGPFVVGNLFQLKEGDELQQREHEFWQNLRATLLGNDVNLGLANAELGTRLKRLRNYAWCGMVVINVLWLTMLSTFYIGITSPLSRLNVYGVISGALYGFTLVIQVIGLTAFRLDYMLRKLAESTYGRKLPFWVNEKEQ